MSWEQWLLAGITSPLEQYLSVHFMQPTGESPSGQRDAFDILLSILDLNSSM